MEGKSTGLGYRVPILPSPDLETLGKTLPLCASVSPFVKGRALTACLHGFLQALMFCGSVILGLSGEILSCSPRKVPAALA